MRPTEDAAAALDVARRIRSGICHINGATVHDALWITIQSGSRHYPV
ncbi:hypothetical protein [Streptomyces sp. DSM 15324]|nr:hypothetical protein [Streptomyces sp. DSM 15324]